MKHILVIILSFLLISCNQSEVKELKKENSSLSFDIMKMDDYNYDKLKEIFWDVVEIDHYTENYKVRVVTTDADGNKVIKTKTKYVLNKLF